MGILNQQLVELVLALSLFHQAIVELFKFLSKSKARHYYQALAYIVYGPLRAFGWTQSSAHVVRSLFRKQWLVPADLGAGGQAEWAQGPQARLIESFLLRSVGDSPVTELSDADVENVARIARLKASSEVRRTIDLLESLLARGTSTRTEVVQALKTIKAKGVVGREISGWIAHLQESEVPVGALLEVWRREFIEKHLAGEVRARTELSNALRAAELRYHRTLARFSQTLALAEAIGVALVLGGQDHYLEKAVAGAVAFGALIVTPQGTKSLLDAVIGLGARLKP